jgi:hypothetical protein
MEWFKIDWRGPYPIETAHAKLGAGGFGIYAIYEMKGKTAKLLYIGETYWQSFGKRLQQHKREWLHRVSGRIVIHFGAVGLPEGKRISHEKVLDVENALIHVLMPPFNTVSKHGYSGREIMIFNLGKVGTLQRLICTKELRALLKAVKTDI